VRSSQTEVPRSPSCKTSRPKWHATDPAGTTASPPVSSKRRVRQVRGSEAGFLETRGDDRLWVQDPEGTLEAWRASYDFTAHDILRGLVPERDPAAVVARLPRALRARGIEPAVTGLGAAWHYARFAGHRLSTLFVPSIPPAPILSEAGLQPGPIGANTWLVEPFDRSVFQDTVSEEGVTFVSPLQAYLDLKGNPERSDEAARALRPLVLRAEG
jgi:hypothetical protein